MTPLTTYTCGVNYDWRGVEHSDTTYYIHMVLTATGRGGELSDTTYNIHMWC